MKILKISLAALAGFVLLVVGGLFAANWLLFEVDEVTFESNGVQLAGSTVSLRFSDPAAAMVFVHGSGASERNLTAGKLFATNGIAALVYDKRGVGESGGVYDEDRNADGETLRLLAADASAAILAAKARFEPVPVGLIGTSQAGWIIPLAAAENPDVAFIGLFSGPVTTVSEEDMFSEFTGDQESLEDIPDFEVIRAEMNSYVWPEDRGEDIDPIPSLRTLSIPGLWIFGANDAVMPVGLSVQRLEALAREGHAFEHVLLDDTGHSTANPQTVTRMAGWIKDAVGN